MYGVSEEYERGVNDYFAGEIPTGWEECRWTDEDIVKAARAPYIMGWYQASMADNGFI